MIPERWNEIKDKLHAALELGTAERDAYLNEVAAANPDLRHELESLMASHDQAGADFLNTSAAHAVLELDKGCAPASSIGRRIGPYQIVEEIGAGGMGEVYRAFRADDQYQKQVAIKLVRAGQDSGFVINRFKNERQILATLDHPNIARLLDGGTTEQGVPYFVMELIEGQPIDEYCSKHQLSVSERLKVFLLVCSAVQYAHQRLIIHRDIKPSNILVTLDATPKLLDFGIAKLLDTDAVEGRFEPTLTVFRVLTPGYASPEQVKGEPITTASDVYSLGVVLYELLTGCHPYRRPNSTAQEIARSVCEVEPEKPSSAVRRTEGDANDPGTSPTTPAVLEQFGESAEKVSRRLRGDLDNILLMALRKEPQRRYASGEQLAEDIRRHLENRPVLARKDTARYRTAKFITRHKAGVAATALVAIAITVGMAATLHEARVARAQQQRAEQHFKDVRELANSLIFDVHDSIQDLPGATAARKLIVDKALHYLDSIARESQNDLSLQRELAAAYKRIGDVQGFQFNANLGDRAAALVSYQKAVAIRKALYSANPNDVADALELAESLRLVSQTQDAENDLTGALQNAQEVVRIAEPLAESHPNDSSALLELARAYVSVGNVLAGPSLCNFGENATATEYRRKQLEAAQRLANLDPTNATAQILGASLGGLADQLFYGGERASALQYYDQARSIFADLASRSQRRRNVYLLNYVSRAIAVVERSNGEFLRALATARDTAESGRKLSEEDPHDEQAGMALADYYVLLADLESRAGNPQKASLNLHGATVLMTQFAGANPKDTESTASLAALKVVAGDLASRSGDKHAAVTFYAAAIALLGPVQSENPSNIAASVRLAAVYNRMGAAQIKLHDLKAAAAAFDRARVLVDVAEAAARVNAEALYTIANSYSGLGEAEAALAKDTRQENRSRIEHWRQAVFWYEQCLRATAQIKEPGMVSPDGFDAVPPAVTTQRLMLARAALARLTQT